MELLLALNNLAHYIGIAFGLGGATIAFIISRKADKDQKSAKVLMPLMRSISTLIFIGLLLLVVSGIGLMFTVKWPLNKPLLVVKHILVALIFINGIYLGRASRKIEKLKGTSKFDEVRKRMKNIGAFNLFLWYFVTVISVVI